MFVMRIMAKDKVKLDSHLGLLPPVIKSRLEKHTIWAEDTGYEKFEVNRHPTNHVVDLGKRLNSMCSYLCCICQSEQAPGGLLPQLDNYGVLQRNIQRRKDADEGTSSSKNSKPSSTMKRQLRQFTYKYCLQKGHTKRGCEKKRAFDAATAAKATEATKDPKNATAQATAIATTIATLDGTATATTSTATTIDTATATTTNNIPATSTTVSTGHASEIDLRSPPPTPSIVVDPMKGASSATASCFTNFMKFVPTPGFKHPRKK
ncbi:hypothetical protein Ahy_B06g084211 [Arachis hypogaea]|uniref:Uncharacterized protein n=1 Tax=Arachis hypogaea TaxID=3818 RepID=A0A444YRD9_ARAHY|nr:hypothetical protein Ahy_B06g084211 [Arachis hypogaea]